MKPAEFDVLVEHAVALIPARFRQRMENLAITVEMEGPSSDLLGLYEGRPVTERSVSDFPVGPDRIRIFQRPHERMSVSVAELEQHVIDTVWHEVGHYFGLTEKEIHAVEARRDRLRTLRRSRLASTGLLAKPRGKR